MPVPENIFPQSISGSTSLKYLIPTTTGAGVCTTSLVDFLVVTHNDFVEKCHNAIPAKSDERFVFIFKTALVKFCVQILQIFQTCFAYTFVRGL